MTDTPPRLDGATESIRTAYMSQDNHEALRSMAEASGTTGSAILRRIFDDYLAGKLTIAEDRPVKTSLWIPPEDWEKLKVATRDDRISIARVIDAGMRKLRGRS